MQARMQRGVTRVVTPLNLSEVKFSGSTFGSCTTVTAQFSSFVHHGGWHHHSPVSPTEDSLTHTPHSKAVVWYSGAFRCPSSPSTVNWQ